MFGNKIYELSLVKDYVSHWGLPEAARELIQNSLDSNSPFKFAFLPDANEADERVWQFTLTSEFSRLEPHQLLLGSTSKREDKAAIGSFGEGFKIALLVLTRLGHQVVVQNNEFEWRPRFRFNKTYGTELLVIEEERLSKHDPGLSFTVAGLTDQDRAAIEASCLKMQPEVGQVIPTSYGDILVDRPGELYVGSLFITKTEHKYGYNIKPEFIRLERDRQTVDSFDLKNTTTQMWFETKRYDQIAEMIAEELPDTDYARYHSPEMVKEACYQLFKKRNPGKFVAANQQQLEEMVKRGMTETIVVGGGWYSSINSSDSYRSALASASVPVKTPHAVLQEWYEEAKYHMHDSAKRSFAAVLDQAKRWKV